MSAVRKYVSAVVLAICAVITFIASLGIGNGLSQNPHELLDVFGSGVPGAGVWALVLVVSMAVAFGTLLSGSE